MWQTHIWSLSKYFTRTFMCRCITKDVCSDKGRIFYWIKSIHFPSIFVEYPYLTFLAPINCQRFISSFPIYSRPHFNNSYKSWHWSLILVIYTARFAKLAVVTRSYCCRWACRNVFTQRNTWHEFWSDMNKNCDSYNESIRVKFIKIWTWYL
jgi:hypothetical protein